ncbi:hypothetical protein P7C71_g2393, partial [Lecanoromycetidae sp. Uapishka_2]
MTRNTAFHSQSHKPLRADPSLELQHDRVTGPFSFLNPTRAAFKHNSAKNRRYSSPDGLQTSDDHNSKEKNSNHSDQQLASNIEFKWRSRDNRKGRHTLVVEPSSDPSAPYLTPKSTSGGREVLKGIGRVVEQSVETSSTGDAWMWFPSWQELKTHYLRELGFLASLAQFCGATIFWISGFTALPGINNKMSQGLLDGIYWVPQMVGGSGFIISGSLYMLETQPKWYVPAWEVLGWHIGFWNLIGAFGFTLCGALGPAYGNTGAQYEASLATFWGSWAFLIGSVIQWYESLSKHPVEVRQT